MVLAYVTNRAIQMRLDEVCGPMGWQNQYKEAPNGGIMCGISIWDAEKQQWVTKWDGAENTQVEAVKGGLSGSMKRAAVQWGIGRYLYKLPTTFADCQGNKPTNSEAHLYGQQYVKETKGKFWWRHPQLPNWALPGGKPGMNLLAAAITKHLDTITVIKESIASGDLSAGCEAWMELSDDEKTSIWVAPSKGGPFTTQEREIIRSTEFKNANGGQNG
jgi:hypothetical protein